MGTILKFPRRDPIDRAAAGAAGAPLTAAQIKRLILVARRAWQCQRDLGLCTDDFDTFRYAAAWETVGLSSLRAMTQRHYPAVLARYHALAGEDRAALRQRERLVGDGYRRALAKLRLECAALADAWGDDPSAAWAYAERLSLALNKAPLSQASERGVWRAIFTLRHRAGQLRRKAAKNAAVSPAPPPTPKHPRQPRKAPSRGSAGGQCPFAGHAD